MGDRIADQAKENTWASLGLPPATTDWQRNSKRIPAAFANFILF
jgi:hypothetical protein